MMSVPVYVDAHSGYQPTERPRQFVLDDEFYRIAAVLYRWYEPSATYFKIQTNAGKVYLLRYDAGGDEWTLQSGFDGDDLLGRPGIELVVVDADLIREAEKLIESCENCHFEDSEIPFDWILDRVTGRDATVVDYILTEPARCPACGREVSEKTLIEPNEG